METKDRDIQDFLYYMIHSKSLTREQKAKRDRLLVRDLSVRFTTEKEVQSTNDNQERICTIHSPSKIVSFLHQFTDEKTLALKLTTHFWDKNSRTNSYRYDTFQDFKDDYLKILNDKEGFPLYMVEPLCNHLWQTIKNFLVNDEGVYPWSKYKLRIGYNKYLKQWMDNNPGMQPFSMPLNAFPEDIRPKKRIDGKSLIYFSHIVEIFKHCIEFRDDSFYDEVEDIFNSPDHHIDLDGLDTLKGIVFYTDTELVKDALRIIASNIFQRPQYPNLRITCELVHISKEERIQLTILQKGSYSNRNINDPKLSGNSKDGDIFRIKNKLKNLSDFAVESRFRVGDEIRHCRINYLSSDEMEQDVVFFENSECLGFTYILTFYTYRHE